MKIPWWLLGDLSAGAATILIMVFVEHLPW